MNEEQRPLKLALDLSRPLRVEQVPSFISAFTRG